MWVYVFSVYPFPCDDWENMHTLAYYHDQIGSMNYYPLFRIRSWNNGVCCMSHYVLMDVALRPRQRCRHFVDIFICIFLNESVWISLTISLKFVPKVPFNNIPALVQIMTWCRPSDKPLFETMMVNLLTYICFTLPRWVKPKMMCTHTGKFPQWKTSISG